MLYTMRWLRLVRRVLLSLLGFSLLVVGATALGIAAYSMDYSTGSADAALVLGAAVRGGGPGPALQARLDHALSLYRQRRVKKLLLTGGSQAQGATAEALAGQKYLLARKVPAADLLVETRSHSTEGNLYYGREAAAQAGIKGLLLVSDPLHLPRASLIAWDLGLRTEQSPSPDSPFRGLEARVRFLARETYKVLRFAAHRLQGTAYQEPYL